MENSPAFQFYASDILASLQGLPDLAKAKLLLLLASLWVQKKQGFAINDDEFLSNMTASTVDEWKSIKKHALILGFLEETDDGFICSPYLLKTLQKQLERREKLAQNGSKGGQAKARTNSAKKDSSKCLAIAKQKLSLSSPSPSSIPSEYTPLPPKGESEGFQKFYSEYPKKTTKAEALAFWQKNKLDSQTETIISGIEKWKRSDQWTKDGGKFIPDAVRFLSKSKWLDDPPAALPVASVSNRPQGTMLPGNQITPNSQRTTGTWSFNQ